MVISGIVDESPNSLLPCPARIREVSAKQLSGANLKLVSLWDSSWLQLRLPGPLLLGVVDCIMSLQFDHVGRQAAGPGMYLVTEKVAGGEGASKQTGAAWSPIPLRDTDLLSEHPRR